MDKKFRILAASDLHGDMKIARRLSKLAKKEKVNLVILAGDINGQDSRNGEVLAPFEKDGHKVVFVPGNHDTEEEHLKMSKKALSLDRSYASFGDIGIAGVGACESFSLSKEDLKKIEKAFGRMNSRKKILVSHIHPARGIAEFSGWPGDPILRHAVEKFKPDILIASHIHEAEGLEDLIGKTKVFQVGSLGRIIDV